MKYEYAIIKGRMSNGVQSMRKCMILISSLCMAFSILWGISTRMILAFSPRMPVLSLDALGEDSALEFPFKIPGTTLIAEQIVSYDGLFTEGDAAQDVVNVAAILLYNYGQQGISEANIYLQAGEDFFSFCADTIPAGARILVPEKTAKAFCVRKITHCSGWQNTDISDWKQENLLELTYPKLGEVVVRNKTDRQLGEILLYYKTYYSQSDFYVGGNTFVYYIAGLQPGESLCIKPYNYAFGYSKFAKIEIQNPES